MIDPESIRGGQLWQQDDYPCHSRLVTVLPTLGFALISDPRNQGSVVCTDEDGQWTYTPEQLAEKFTRLRYTCKGQVRDVS